MDSKLSQNVTVIDLDSRYRQLVYALPAAVYTCDPEGYVKIYNKAAVDLWGREPEIGRDLWCGSWKIYKPDGSPLPLDQCPMAIALKEARPVHGAEIIVERPDGEKRVVLPHPRPIFDEAGNVVEAVNMLVDITDHKERQQKEKAKLERLVSLRTRELRKINSELERSNQELEQYAYVASHDLQEPLRKILTFSNLMHERHAGELDGEALKILNKIEGSAKRMTQLIKDLLTFSRLSQKEPEFFKTDLNYVLSKVRTDFEILINQKHATITNDPLPVVDAIPVQIEQLFNNLVGNALKFSSPQRPPAVHISARPLSKEEVLKKYDLSGSEEYYDIVVKDNGIGFHPRYAETIFEIFNRLKENPNTEGSGIGLALCRKIALNHKGHIFAIGHENQGAEFHLIFPATTP